MIPKRDRYDRLMLARRNIFVEAPSGVAIVCGTRQTVFITTGAWNGHGLIEGTIRRHIVANDGIFTGRAWNLARLHEVIKQLEDAS